MPSKKPYRDKYGRFAKRGVKRKSPQPRDQYGRYVARPKPKRKKKPVSRKHLSPKFKKPIPPPTRDVPKFRFRTFDIPEGEDEEGVEELEEIWQEDYEDEFSALDAMDGLDNLMETEDEWYEER